MTAEQEGRLKVIQPLQGKDGIQHFLHMALSKLSHKSPLHLWLLLKVIQALQCKEGIQHFLHMTLSNTFMTAVKGLSATVV